MLTVWKFQLPVEDTFDVEMPADAQLLTVGVQAGQHTVWALVNPDARTEKRHFRLAGTGHHLEMRLPYSYVGTFHRTDGLVFHLFEAQ